MYKAASGKHFILFQCLISRIISTFLLNAMVFNLRKSNTDNRNIMRSKREKRMKRKDKGNP